ncbi:hypothetical protein HXK74_00655 [Candidatus Gracilibacteria bacterium]|nr:hypothetical protein [Candidatus Gracilibacteria bacterium]
MVKKTLHIYQLYRQNLKIGFLFLLVSLLGACTQKQMLKPEQVSSIAPVLSGTQQATPERIDDPNIPNCEPLDLKPIKPQEIINIDDVVQNCSYETGHILYNPYGGGGNLPEIIDLRKNGVMSVDFKWAEEISPICEYKGIPYYPTKEMDKALVAFIKKNNILDNNYFSSLYSEGQETKTSVDFAFGCKEKHLCSKLIDYTFGSNNKHQFFRTNQYGGEYLVVDNKIIYNLGQSFYNNDDDIYTETFRVVNSLKNDTIYISKYINGKLIEKYRNNKNLSDEEYERTNKSPIIGTFQVKTCEIPL